MAVLLGWRITGEDLTPMWMAGIVIAVGAISAGIIFRPARTAVFLKDSPGRLSVGW